MLYQINWLCIDTTKHWKIDTAIEFQRLTRVFTIVVSLGFPEITGKASTFDQYIEIIFQVLFIFFWALNINAKRLLFLLFLSQIINWINTNDMQEHDQQNSKEHLQSYPSLSLTTSFLIILIMKHGQVTWTKNLKNWTYISTSCLYKQVFNCLKWQPNLRFHNFFSCGG